MQTAVEQHATEFDAISHLNISPTQAKVVAALARGGTITRAARATGVHRTTIHNWFRNEPEFKAAVQLAQREFITTLADSVRELGDLAIDALRDVLIHGASTTRLKAALAVLERAGSTNPGWSLPDYRVDTPPEQVLFGPAATALPPAEPRP